MRGGCSRPFLTEGYEGLNIDDEDDFARAEALVASGDAMLPTIDRTPYPLRPADAPVSDDG